MTNPRKFLSTELLANKVKDPPACSNPTQKNMTKIERIPI